jgi:hypothetical protein
MNKLIDFLNAENNVTIERLNQVHRLLCKKLHPDITKKSGERFLNLQREYEEAFGILSGIQGSVTDGKKTDTSENKDRIFGNPRETVLSYLYLYSLKLFSRDGNIILLKLIDASKEYDDKVHSLLEDYNRVFYETRNTWQNDGNIFYAHNMLIASIKQLFYFYSIPLKHHKTLLITYLSDIGKMMKKLSAEQRSILTGMAAWIKNEMFEKGISTDFITQCYFSRNQGT